MDQNNDNNLDTTSRPPIMHGEFIQKRLMAIALAVLVVGVVLFAYYMPGTFRVFKTSTTMVPVTNEDFKKAREMFTINPSMSKELLEKALPEVEANSDEEGYIKLYLGTTLLDDTDYQRGISLLKEVAFSDSYLPITRSSAINNLMLYFDSTRSNALAEIIFSGEKWKELINANAKNRTTANYDAELKGFEWSIDIYPNYLAYLKASSMYGYKMFTSKNKTKKEEYSKKVKDYVEKGTILASKTLSERDDIENYVSQFVNSQLYKAAALEQLYVYEKNGELINEIQSTYDLALKYLEDNSKVFQANNLFGKYYYNRSAFLMRQIKPTPNSEINVNLKRIFDNPNDPIIESFKKLKHSPSSSFFKAEVLQLAKLDSDFKLNLIKIGWAESDFVTR